MTEAKPYEFMRWLLLPLVMGAFLVMGCMQAYPPDDGDTLFFPNSRAVRITIASREKPLGDDRYAGAIVQFVKLVDGQWVVPFTEDEHFLHGGASKDARISSPRIPLAHYVAFLVPVDARITRRVFFIRGDAERSGWRYFEFNDLPSSGGIGKRDILLIGFVVTTHSFS